MNKYQYGYNIFIMIDKDRIQILNDELPDSKRDHESL